MGSQLKKALLIKAERDDMGDMRIVLYPPHTSRILDPIRASDYAEMHPSAGIIVRNRSFTDLLKDLAKLELYNPTQRMET
jgi:hypothetical protein